MHMSYDQEYAAHHDWLRIESLLSCKFQHWSGYRVVRVRKSLIDDASHANHHQAPRIIFQTVAIATGAILLLLLLMLRTARSWAQLQAQNYQ